MSTGVESKEISQKTDELFSAILSEQQKIDSLRPKPAHCEKKGLSATILESLLKEYEQSRGRAFFYPYISTGRGHGPFTELIDGSVKFDLINSMGVNLLGHSHPLYIRANLEAAASDVVMCGNLLPYKEPLELSRLLLNTVKDSRLHHFWFAGSGSFANDIALKIIWQKKAPSYRIIAFERAFAGRSVATQDITFNPLYREGMPRFLPVDHVPHFFDDLDRTLNALDQLWSKHGSNPDPGPGPKYAALTVELIQGEAGFRHGTANYYKRLFEWAKERDLYIWVDEVQTFGRTRELFAYQMFGLDEYVDVVTVGKSLQCCGTFFTEELNPRPLLIAGTFIASLASLKAGQKIVRYLTEGNFYGEGGRIHKLEQTFTGHLKKLTKSGQPIKNIRGIGTMISFQVDRGEKNQTIAFVKVLFNKGIICYIAGKDPYLVRFLLPLSILDKHIDHIFLILEEALNEFFKGRQYVSPSIGQT